MLITPGVSAFKGQEHIKGSNCAVDLVLERIAGCRCTPDDKEPTRGCEVCRTAEKELEAFRGESGPCDTGRKPPARLRKAEEGSYGLLVSTIDYLQDPLEYLQLDGAGARKKYLDTARGHLRHSWSAHNNEVHFQSEALVSFWYWHSSAIQVAAHGYSEATGTTRPRLDIALQLNAIGDHFLQDSLAPGHIITPRASMHDLPAMSMHDRYNVLGAAFRLDDWCGLQEIAADRGPVSMALRGGPMHDCDPDAVPREANPLFEASCESGFLVDLWGDGMLHCSPGQEALFVLLTARSILDVVHAYSTGEAESGFAGYGWTPMTRQTGGARRLSLARAELRPFGGYEEASAGRLFYGGTSLAFGYSSEYFFTRAGDEPGRGVFSVELIPALLPAGRKNDRGEYEPRNHQWLFSVGYARVYNKTLHGGGPTARLILAIPKIDLSFSAELGMRTVRAERGVEWTRPHYGVRVDLGFSLLTFHLGVARAYFRDVETVFDERRRPTGFVEVPRAGYAIRAGMAFGVPLSKFSRILGSKRLMRRRLSRDRP